MAISRLLHPTPRLRFSNGGFIKSTRWCSSSSTGNAQKLTELKEPEPEEKREVAAESKQYMKVHPNMLSEATQVEKKERSSWLKGILSTIKDAMLGDSEYQKQITGKTSDSMVDLTAPEVNITEKQHNPKSHERQNANQLPEARRNYQSVVESVSTRSTSYLVEENTLEGAVETDASQVMPSYAMGENNLENGVDVIDLKVVKVHNNPDNSDLGKMQSIVELSEAVIDSHDNERNVSTTSTSDIMGGSSSDEAELVKPKMKHKQIDVLLDIFTNSGKDRGSGVVDFSHLTRELMNEKSRALQEDGVDELSSFGNGNHQLDNKSANDISLPSKTIEVRKVASSIGSSKVKDNFTRDIPNRMAGEMAGSLSNILELNKISGNADEPKPEVGNKLEIQELLHLIKRHPGEKSTNKTQESSISNVIGQVRTRKSIKKIQPLVNLQTSDAKRQTSSKGHDTSIEIDNGCKGKEEPCMGIPPEIHGKSTSEHDSGSLEAATYDLIKSKPHPHCPLPASEKLIRTSDTSFIEEGSSENKILVRFLKINIERGSIIAAFKDCGEIVNVDEISSKKGCTYKDAFVHFKTREGCKKALEKSDLIVNQLPDAFVEATSLEDMTEGVPIPDVISDCEVPVALLKNPTKTVKVMHLTHDISSQHLRDVFAFCKSSITSVFLGSLSSIVYVEFETEDAKERALAKGSIYVSGKQLMLFRIDAPRTTVVRISNAKLNDKFGKICKSYGQVRGIYRRSNDHIDVHFKVAEWPNMVEILNGLNGIEVDGSRWVAQPAPVFPPEILWALWSRPEGRRHVKAAIDGLLRQLEEPLDTAQLGDLAAKYYGQRILMNPSSKC